MSTVLPGFGDQPGHRFLGVGRGAQDGGYLVAGHFTVQAVGAEKQAISGKELFLFVNLYVHPGGDAQGAGNDVTVGVAAGLFRLEEADLHLLGHPGMILGELTQQVIPIEISPAVAGVGDGQLAPGRANHSRNHRRGHLLLRRIAAG